MLWFQTIRANNAVAEALALSKPDFSPKKTKDGRVLLSLLKETEKLQKQMKEKYPNFEPPSCGVYSWTGEEPDRLSASDLRRKKEQIQETLANWDSPEVKRFFASLDGYASLLPFSGVEVTDVKNFQILNTLRSFARYQAGRAQVAHYQGRKKDILPPLEKISPFDQALSGSRMVISELVRCAVFAIQYNGYVNLGPTGPEYADFYRRMLNYCRNWHFSIPGELDIYVYGLQNRCAGINRKPEKILFLDWNFSFSTALLLRPLELNLLTTLVKQGIAAWKMSPLLDKADRFPVENGYTAFVRSLEAGTLSEIDWAKIEDEKDADLSGLDLYYQKNLIARSYARLRCAKTLAVTGIALKLYKCLHGAYPEKLESLTPEILKALPNDPYTGKPYRYTLKDGEFTLQSGKKNFYLRSKARY